MHKFFVKEKMHKAINNTPVTLIPKKLEEKMVRDYRPISSCLIIYNVISKIMTNRQGECVDQYSVQEPCSFCTWSRYP